MKTIIICAAMLLATSSYAGPITSDSLIKTFNQHFPDAKNIKWHQGNNFFEVSFTDIDVPQRIYYDENGKVFRTLRYYDATKLNPFISQRIKEKYGNRTIKSVTEMRENSGTVYQVILQDKKHLYVVNCNEDGEMYLQNRFKNA